MKQYESKIKKSKMQVTAKEIELNVGLFKVISDGTLHNTVVTADGNAISGVQQLVITFDINKSQLATISIVKHELVNKMKPMDESNKLLKEDLKTKDFNSIVSWGMTQDENKLDKEILKTRDDYGYTVAHEMAFKGYEFTDPEILRLKDIYGFTVAHEMAYNGYIFTDPEILKTKDNDGWTVEDVMKWVK